MEICINNEWGTVCDDFWGDNDAEVVCRQTGNSGGNNIRCPLKFVFLFVLLKILYVDRQEILIVLVSYCPSLLFYRSYISIWNIQFYVYVHNSFLIQEMILIVTLSHVFDTLNVVGITIIELQLVRKVITRYLTCDYSIVVVSLHSF